MLPEVLALQIDACVYGMSPFGGVITYWDHVLSGLDEAGLEIELVLPSILKADVPIKGALSRTSDVFLSTYFTLPARRTLRSALVVHDLIYESDPSLVAELDPDPRILERKAGCIRAASAVVVPTRAVASALREHHPAMSAPVHVIPHGIADAFVPASSEHSDVASRRALISNGVRRPFVLHIGGREAYKSFDSVLEVYSESNALQRDFDLVAVGSTAHPSPAEEDLLADCCRGGRVAFVGEVDVRVLASLMRAATVVVSASRMEGFGLPVAEALACGTPVACTSIPAYIENYEGLASFFVPNDAAGLEAALLEAANSGHETRHLRATEVRKRFRWSESVSQLIRVIRTVAHPVGCRGR